MTLRAIRLTTSLGREGPERCELGPDLQSALSAARAEAGPAAVVIREDDLGQLDACRALLVDRGRKHPAKPLAPLLLHQPKIPLIRGGHTSPGQLLRSVRALLARAEQAGDSNLFVIAAPPPAFGELWARALDPAAARWQEAHPPALSSVRPPSAAARTRPSEHGGLAGLLRELPIPESVRERFRGDSPEAGLVLQLVLRAARQDDPVLVLGDTGTGKEVVARLIHDESPRRLQTFLPVNCGAIPRELFESELFGYEKGSHSTARERKVGLWERAGGGTLFLDEIADLTLDHQVKVLRAIETGMVRPVGAVQEIKVDARIVAATNRDLFGMMQAGEFREDLYYRLRAFLIRTPALRDHPEDIPGLANHFWRAITRQPDGALPADLLAELERYRWPGNARELRMVLSSLFALFGDEELGIRHLRAVFEFEGQAGGAGGQQPPALSELALHRVECLRRLRRADEVVRAIQIAVRPLADGPSELALSALVHLDSELELLCGQPVLFHGEQVFSCTRAVGERLRSLLTALREPPTPNLPLGGQELARECDLALSAIFKEVDRLLDAASRGD